MNGLPLPCRVDKWWMIPAARIGSGEIQEFPMYGRKIEAGFDLHFRVSGSVRACFLAPDMDKGCGIRVHDAS